MFAELILLVLLIVDMILEALMMVDISATRAKVEQK